MKVTLLLLLRRTAFLREIPFKEVAASVRTAVCLGPTAVLAVVVREGVALVAGVVVLV